MEELSNKLYVVATPIGNLNELTPRAVFILSNVDYICAEDTRNTLKLCTHFNIKTPLVSCHEYNEFEQSDKIILDILHGKKVALTSDAGYPGISDPGNILIRKAAENNIEIEVISGPCALINGLVGSGLDTTHFYFYGFLSNKHNDRIKELKSLKDRKETIIFYEAPHRIQDTLIDIKDTFGNRYACIAKELTKLHEKYLRGDVESLINLSLKEDIKGEIVLIVEGNHEENIVSLSNVEIIDEVNKLVDKGMSTKDAIKEVAKNFDINKNEVYRIFHQ